MKLRSNIWKKDIHLNSSRTQHEVIDTDNMIYPCSAQGINKFDLKPITVYHIKMSPRNIVQGVFCSQVYKRKTF